MNENCQNTRSDFFQQITILAKEKRAQGVVQSNRDLAPVFALYSQDSLSISDFSKNPRFRQPKRTFVLIEVLLYFDRGYKKCCQGTFIEIDWSLLPKYVHRKKVFKNILMHFYIFGRPKLPPNLPISHSLLLLWEWK